MPGPVVGTAPDYEMDGQRVPWVLGTQLHPEVGPLGRAPAGSRVLMIEAREFARRRPYHHDKLTLVFSAMRQFRDELRERGYDVEYITAETFREGLSRYFERHPGDTPVAMRSPSYRSGSRMAELVGEIGGDLDVVDNELFVSTRRAFDEWANGDTDSFRHESFYRWMRRRSGVLLTDDGNPVGGEWNLDDENQEFPPPEWSPPERYEPDHGEAVRETSEWVREEFETWGADEGFRWPTTREQARNVLEQFCERRLPEFGPYQDAMRSRDWAMAHALLSPALNLGLLHPWEAITAIEEAYESREDIPLNSAEGVLRQLLGWREFMRHVYRHAMPELATANQLGAERPLPEFYWSGETEMNCLAETVEDVHERGYAHHIQRLMVLANFATLWGVEPRELNEWFHATYVDAYHWVTTPNVVEMGQYGHGVFATKPYVSSASYVDRMSDYCGDCHYYKTKDTGDRACPFNSLYWDFLARNEEQLRGNHRMGLMYSHVDDKRESGDLAAIRERVDDLREMADAGEL
ncbi:cryptochrome/photolyase family protein [Halovenus sp. WSH3]|uniref:Cryptochrome/photolyase family protein n=1 Tax=Halovenus carboxidivorans TaxID=2692199 RepID=A0A6B0TAD5_9EURY|nr:cryptochrome/photolyase family protein [Halovenus carboxidivorans]MXR53146.1 cryptochrome/photolyase family protein [Halovenus carboxidivorans]